MRKSFWQTLWVPPNFRKLKGNLIYMTPLKISLVTFLAVVFFAAPGLAQTAGQATIQDTNVMGSFFDQIENISGRLLPFAEWLFYSVLLIQIVYVGLMWMSGAGLALEYIWRNVLLIGF